jgi:hypothetical protein
MPSENGGHGLVALREKDCMIYVDIYGSVMLGLVDNPSEHILNTT